MKSESEGDLLLCVSVGCSFWRFISRVLFAFFEGHVFFWGDESHTIQLFSVFLEFIRNRTFSSPTTKCRGEEEEEQTVTPLRRTVFCCVPNSFWVKVTKEMLYEMKWLCWSSSLLDHQPTIMMMTMQAQNSSHTKDIHDTRDVFCGNKKTKNELNRMNEFDCSQIEIP